jgi:hypothetical protein
LGVEIRGLLVSASRRILAILLELQPKEKALPRLILIKKSILLFRGKGTGGAKIQ